MCSNWLYWIKCISVFISGKLFHEYIWICYTIHILYFLCTDIIGTSYKSQLYMYQFYTNYLCVYSLSSSLLFFCWFIQFGLTFYLFIAIIIDLPVSVAHSAVHRGTLIRVSPNSKFNLAMSLLLVQLTVKNLHKSSSTN